MVGKSHPNIFEIIDVMRKEQAITEMKFEAGAMQPSRKRRYVKRDERGSTLFERFQNGQCNLADYLAAVRHQTGLYGTIIMVEFVCAF